MCGGTIEFEPGATVGVCDHCGTKQTLPRLDDEKRSSLYDRANHFRRNNEYDKAASIYEQILNEDNTDAEAYWSLVLCEFGIEYVEDPATHKRVPTVNRTQFSSIFNDENYKSAIKYADISQKVIYEEEAETINNIQKGILAISQKEDPFDVFICYKETDENGRRTRDSVLAQELYYQLKQEGFKIFFSRITLEDKIGSAYEPYIFAALNSAKVMVVLGTKPEYFNAPWVKNEWSRYLALVKKSNGKKILIPAYRDMDPYDLPEEFSLLQALDMSKLGFMQDLIRGIKKIITASAPKPAQKETVVINQGPANIDPLLDRAFLFLEDGNWADADEYCERVLDLNPRCAEAYLGKMMAQLHVRRREELAEQSAPFTDNSNYSKAVRFADEKLKSELNRYLDGIKNRIEQNRLSDLYENAVYSMRSANTEESYKYAANKFKDLSGFKDSDSLYDECLKGAEEARKSKIYSTALGYMDGGSIRNLENAIQQFESIKGYKDADEQISICYSLIEDIKEKEEREKSRREAERLRKEEARSKRRKKHNDLNEQVASASNIRPAAKGNKKKLLVPIFLVAIIVLGFIGIKIVYNGRYSHYVGTNIELGHYEQDNDSRNGKESISWRILEVKGNKALVISKYVLDCKPYNNEHISITWETCTLRRWLNSDFFYDAFSSEEQASILTTKVTSDMNPLYSTDPGNNTNDKVFLFSINEVDQYFYDSANRKCKPTKYAIKQGCSISSDGYSWWWLRSPGNSQDSATQVSSDGSVRDVGSRVHGGGGGIRPTMWIDLESIVDKAEDEAVSYSEKTVPLVVNYHGDPWAGTSIYRISVPETIVVKGSSEALSSVSEVYSEEIDIEGIYEDISIDIVPKLPDGIYLSEKNSNLQFQVNLADTGSIHFYYQPNEIKTSNLADGLKVSYSLGNEGYITATVSGPTSVLRTMSASDVIITADGERFTKGQWSVKLSAQTKIEAVNISLSPDIANVYVE